MIAANVKAAVETPRAGGLELREKSREPRMAPVPSTLTKGAGSRQRHQIPKTQGAKSAAHFIGLVIELANLDPPLNNRGPSGGSLATQRR